MPDDLDRALRHRISPEVTVEEFDQTLADTARPGLLHELNQAALGDLAVPGLLTYSFVTRWDLDQAIAALNLGPGRLLLDLACGQGGRVCGWPSGPDAIWWGWISPKPASGLPGSAPRACCPGREPGSN